MYQSIITEQYKKKFDAPVELNTGFYQFHYKGGLITGQVFAIGESVLIKTLTIGTIEIKTLEFIANNPVKL